MLLTRACGVAAAFWKIRVMKRRIPYFAAWNLTLRCNLDCMYCGVNDVQVPEWNTHQVLQGLDDLWELGTRWITFGGGEPLVREDIGDVLGHAIRKGFQVYLSTNGWLASRKTEALRGLHHLNLSLDGSREVHDRIRGKGAFDKAMEAIQVCSDLDIPVSLLCVLSKHNLDEAEEVVEIAAKHRLYAMFQPAERLLHSSGQPNPICPAVDAYRATISRLIDLKRRGAAVRNSVAGLKHLARWPDPCRIRCPAGVLISVVEPDGQLVGCHIVQFDAGQVRQLGSSNQSAGRQQNKLSRDDPAERCAENEPVRLLTQFRTMNTPSNCAQCWCAPLVELSLLLSLSPEPLVNALRVLRG